ncbi:Six-bladed beta-propeller, TolB-like protein [Coniochaeta hoffmannii]|uniref:Six-bladed beta-propeller, TolB-like protein n=1 Tax=Coniochaeta hoffmannii TaxID=91930 RepID=A0AA38VNW1_9PEZI|nr:Six-bladed beta-propeller, TolB-like protein [Coniochaeta hoffmannii]
MSGPAGCKIEDFRKPRLRKCPFDLNSISWKDAKVLGCGVDGWVWRVHFGDRGPFALKLFWVADRPVEEEYFAVQQECQAVAHLQMMQAAVDQANREGGTHPVLLYPDPKTHEDAMANVFAFAEENRLNPPGPEARERDRLVPITSIPRMAKCYGWLRFNTDEILPRIPRKLRPRGVVIEKAERYIEPGKEHIAIVYEYIEDGENDPSKVEEFLEFMYLAGFCFASSHGRNWKHSILVDHSDFIGIASYGWHRSRYRKLPVSYVLRT